MKMPAYMDPTLTRALQAYSADKDLANRVVRPAVAPMIGPDTCACGNHLTIADYGTECRQCVLSRRMGGS
jgi:hypothetical protein